MGGCISKNTKNHVFSWLKHSVALFAVSRMLRRQSRRSFMQWDSESQAESQDWSQDWSHLLQTQPARENLLETQEYAPAAPEPFTEDILETQQYIGVQGMELQGMEVRGGPGAAAKKKLKTKAKWRSGLLR